MSDHDRFAEVLERASIGLMEHFDSVQIVATHYDPESGETTTVAWGHGNFQARFGSVNSWLIAQEARTADHATRSQDDQ